MHDSQAVIHGFCGESEMDCLEIQAGHAVCEFWFIFDSCHIVTNFAHSAEEAKSSYIRLVMQTLVQDMPPLDSGDAVTSDVMAPAVSRMTFTPE